jgi:hypothetical protein
MGGSVENSKPRTSFLTDAYIYVVDILKTSYTAYTLLL